VHQQTKAPDETLPARLRPLKHSFYRALNHHFSNPRQVDVVLQTFKLK